MYNVIEAHRENHIFSILDIILIIVENNTLLE